MNRIEHIDYELDPKLTQDLERIIKMKLQDIFKQSDQSDLFEYIKILTSKEYLYSKEKQEKDLREVCEDESADKVRELVEFI